MLNGRRFGRRSLLPVPNCDSLCPSETGAYCVKILAVRLLATFPACAILITFVPNTGSAAESGTAPVACPQPAVAAMILETPDRKDAPIMMRTEQFDAQREQYAQASGNVEIFRADQTFSTGVLRYAPSTRTVTVPGPLIYEDMQIHIEADSAFFRFEDNIGDFDKVRYSLVGSSANGIASEVQVSGGDRSYLRQLQFTTCPGEKPEWLLSARELELRHDEGIGIARGAKLRLLNVPVLYLPWMSFPIDDRRKSGFLYPHIGSANDIGLEFGIPYYWNIAPNQDATITPRYFTDRGLMLTGEYRFITRKTGGQLDFDVLPHDKKTSENRYHYHGRFDAALSPRWHGKLNIEQVSDNEYFQDFGASLALTSRQFLRSHAGLDSGGRYWIFSMLLDDFQVIDDSVNPRKEPYRRLPRIGFMLDAPLGRQGLQVALDSELVYFDRDTGITGARADFYPSLVWNEDRYWGFFRASAGYRYTSYNLDRHGLPGDESPDRGTGIISLDSGLYLEKLLKNGNRQTLEPRAFYLYVPFENQDDLPDFDTGEFTFGFAQLFHTNRFTGADRQTDANQFTLAVSTRTISAKTGREQWNLNFGQIFYFEPPRVMLDNSMPENLDTSPFIAEFNWQPLGRISARLGVQWSWEDSQLEVGAVGVAHTAKNGNRLGFEYRFRRDRLDQFDVRYYWPVNEQWQLFSRVNYSLRESDLLEALAGVEYESCCWAFRVAARRYHKDRSGGERDAIYFELRLKGLGSLGRRNPPLFYDLAD